MKVNICRECVRRKCKGRVKEGSPIEKLSCSQLLNADSLRKKLKQKGHDIPNELGGIGWSRLEKSDHFDEEQEVEKV